MTESKPSRAPVHLWIVGGLALLWNLMGAVDYVLTMTRNEAYMSHFTPEQLEFFYGFPAWVVALWAIAIWGGLLGIILLLLCRKQAVPVLVVSFACMAATMIHNYGFAGGVEISGGSGIFFSGVVFVVSIALIVYSRAMTRKGILS
ncbi:MAG: hypothetical protein MUF59_10500 [Candidatus Krumholzibacteria bacterium]|nr:hypothetical protein [Candidatus Krumholzibacteria bacterium]